MMNTGTHVSCSKTRAFVRRERAQTGIELVCVDACLLGDAQAHTASETIPLYPYNDPYTTSTSQLKLCP
jgi:hypothetical protein